MSEIHQQNPLNGVELWLGGTRVGEDLMGYIDGLPTAGHMYLGPQGNITEITAAQHYTVVMGGAKWTCEYLAKVDRGDTALPGSGIRLRILNKIS